MVDTNPRLRVRGTTASSSPALAEDPLGSGASNDTWNRSGVYVFGGELHGNLPKE